MIKILTFTLIILIYSGLACDAEIQAAQRMLAPTIKVQNLDFQKLISQAEETLLLLEKKQALSSLLAKTPRVDFSPIQRKIQNSESGEIFSITIEKATINDLERWTSKKRFYKKEAWERTIEFAAKHPSNPVLTFIKATYQKKIIGIYIGHSYFIQELSRKKALYGRITEVDFAWRKYGIGKQLSFAAAQAYEEDGFWSMIDMKSADSRKYIESFGGNIIVGRDGFVYYFISSEKMKQLLRKNELEQAQFESGKDLNLKSSSLVKGFKQIYSSI